MHVYEQALAGDVQWAVREGSMHFEGTGAVHKTLEKFTRHLDELKIPYAIVGGMALFLHGYRRFTEDVDILVSEEGLAQIHEHLTGRGYVPLFEGSKNLRDADHGVRVEFIVTGRYPGDGKPKGIAFPDPATSTTDIGGFSCIDLRTLIELKLASGLAPGRRRDLADVQELIRVLKIPADYSDRLDMSVRKVFDQLWNELNEASPDP
ncbi:MAG: nucleotidyltransferase family protein [Pirellulales bacterium]|nr:nucleotidyltransferase family protein [Pirellulales bacterium]